MSVGLLSTLVEDMKNEIMSGSCDTRLARGERSVRINSVEDWIGAVVSKDSRQEATVEVSMHNTQSSLTMVTYGIEFAKQCPHMHPVFRHGSTP